MFGFGSRKKAIEQPGPRARYVGVELSSTQIRAVSAGEGRTRALHLDGEAEELPLFVTLDRRPGAVGHAAKGIVRKSPHSVCSNYLPLLCQPQEWRGPKIRHTPESATQVVLDKLYTPVVAESDAVGLCLPTYLSLTQIAKLNELTGIAKLPIRGTVAAPLAVAAHRAAFVLSPKVRPDAEPDSSAPGVVQIRPIDASSGAVLIIDVDEYALTASLVVVSQSDVTLQSCCSWPRASLKLWKDRLIDAISDRCVRLCRRDPRDSADAEQTLYDQLDRIMSDTRQGQPTRITVRAAHWFQDMQLQPDEVEGFTQPLLNIALDGLRQFLHASSLAVPPRAVWLSHAAGRLPGLAGKVYKHSPEQTTVSILPTTAFAEAAAALVPRWLVGSVPYGHLDCNIQLQRSGGLSSGESPKPVSTPSASIGKVRK